MATTASNKTSGLLVSNGPLKLINRPAFTAPDTTSQFGPNTPWAQTVANYAANNAPAKSQADATPAETSAGSTIVPESAWTLEGDPVYQAAMASGQSQFNIARANALAAKQADEASIASSRKSLDKGATEARRRLAGNYAARGMAGGAAGALTLAEAEANAQQIAARTSLQDQLSTLNSQYLANFGDAASKGYDWTGTLSGQQYKTAAAQAAIQAQLAKFGAA